MRKYFWALAIALAGCSLINPKRMLLAPEDLPRQKFDWECRSQQVNRHEITVACNSMDRSQKSLVDPFAILVQNIYKGAKLTYPMNSPESYELIKRNMLTKFPQGKLISMDPVKIDTLSDSYTAVQLMMDLPFPAKTDPTTRHIFYSLGLQKKRCITILLVFGSNVTLTEFKQIAQKAAQKIR